MYQRATFHVVSVGPPGNPLGLIIDDLPRYSSRHGHIRELTIHAFPLDPGVTAPALGNLVSVKFDPFEEYKIVKLRVRDQILWQAPEHYFLARLALAPRDHRRRPVAFLAWGVPDRATAVALALAGPPGPDYSGFRADWADVIEIYGPGPNAEKAVWAWYPDWPAQGRHLVP